MKIWMIMIGLGLFLIGSVIAIAFMLILGYVPSAHEIQAGQIMVGFGFLGFIITALAAAAKSDGC